MKSRRGFALLAVLWFVTGAAVVGLGVAMTGREATLTSFNRMALARAAWDAEACLAAARAALASAFSAPEVRDDSLEARWMALDTLVLESSLVRGCPGAVTMVPAGVSLDINAASTGALSRVLHAQGFPPSRVAAMVEAVEEWRRDSAFAAVEELRHVRGFESWDEERPAGGAPTALDRLFTVETGRIVPAFAPPEVLAARPNGMDGSPSLPGDDLATLSTNVPDAWILSARAYGDRAADGTPRLESVIEVRLVRGGRGIAITRRRSYP